MLTESEGIGVSTGIWPKEVFGKAVPIRGCMGENAYAWYLGLVAMFR